MIMVAGDSAGEMVMMWSCCRSSSARRSGEEMAKKKKKRQEKTPLIPIGPQDMESLKNENTVIILIRYKVFFHIILLKRGLQRMHFAAFSPL